MKANIRLFVPNTTEALDFEYGLVIHYMQNNEVKKGHKIGLQYYELAEIEPVNNALDIVEQKIVTDAARHQSKIDGFTLDSHYALSFDQRFNNKIAQESVRQVWLWLNCKNSTEYPFLLEKTTDIEKKMLSQQNQLLVRLWAHADWTDREIQPLTQHKLNGQTELLSVLQQDLSVHFDQIENINRQKTLAELNLKTPQPTPATFIKPEEPVAAYKPAPLFGNSPSLNLNAATPVSIEEISIDQQSQSALANIDSDLLLEQKMLSILQEYSAPNFYTKGNIPIDKLNNAIENYPVDLSDTVLALIDTTSFGNPKAGMLIELKGIYFKSDSRVKSLDYFISWEKLHLINPLHINLVSYTTTVSIKISNENYFEVIKSDVFNIINLLNKLIICYREFFKIVVYEDEQNLILPSDEKNLRSEKNESPFEPKVPSHVKVRNDTSDTIKQPKKSTWWIWLIVILIGFIFHPTVGGLFLVIAIFWYVLRLVFSAKVLIGLIFMAITFGMISLINHF